MSVKMIADKRRKPSRARQKAVKVEKEAEIGRIIQEEIRRGALAMGIEYATPRDY